MPKAIWMLTIAVALLVAGCGAGDSGDNSSSATESESISKTFDIGGGRNLALVCDGAGSPTILLEAGDESGVGDWGLVAPHLMEETRTCRYDRAGVGRSDAATGCRGMDDILGDLESLLKVAKIRGPFLLVGASGGGYLMAEYASRHPADAAGLVLAETPKAISDPPPAELVDVLKCDAPTNVERRDYVAVENEAWGDRKKIGEFPMTIISNEYPKGSPSYELSNVEDQRGWLVLSPNSKQVVVTSGHDVTSDEPELVVREILAILKASRG